MILRRRTSLLPIACRGLRLGFLLGASVAAWSCGDRTVTGIDSSLPLFDRHHATGLLTCTPRAQDSVTVTIGIRGGTIHFGAHALRIPAHALAAPVAITAVAPSDTVGLVRLGPEGLAFRKHADLAIDYSNCQREPKGHARIAYVDDALNIISYVAPGAGDKPEPRGHVVIGRLEHFSNYAVAW